MKNEAESQAVFAVSYVRNVRGRAMLPDSTVHVFFLTLSSLSFLFPYTFRTVALRRNPPACNPREGVVQYLNKERKIRL